MLRRASIALGATVLLAAAVGEPARATLSAHDTCSSCHLPAAAADDPRPARPSADACLECHSPGLPVHGPAARSASETTSDPSAIDCLACHEPHPNGRPYQLRRVEADPEGLPPGATLDSTSRLCLTCHVDAARFRGPSGHFVRHPVGIPVAGGVRGTAGLPLLDVLGTADPADDVIACVTCHRLHGDPPSRLRWTRSTETSACLGCHRLEGEEPGDRIAAKLGG